jgi:hypothetical protein
MNRRRGTRTIAVLVAIAVAGFLVWRFVRPLNIFVVSEAFERPITTTIPQPLKTLSAGECGSCHTDIYAEWKTSIHSQAWTDPYFQADWRFDGSPQNCKNCHVPLDRQQEHRVIGFRDADKWQPILEPNPGFDAQLQHEGVTCAVCHLRDGKILGPRGDPSAPHPVTPLAESNEVCVRCHVVGNNRWDTFYRFPPCGTVMEIERTRAGHILPRGGEAVVKDVASLGCVQCHMPIVDRPVSTGGPLRTTRRHLWRGGHDPAMVRSALRAEIIEVPAGNGTPHIEFVVENIGTDHFLPTGTPDRHLTVTLRALAADGRVLREKHAALKRTVMWRPFIVDLRDTRLPRGEPRRFRLDLPARSNTVEAEVRYHLLTESRRQRIRYRNAEPISYPVFQERRLIAETQ